MNLSVKMKLGMSFAALTALVLLVSVLAMVALARFNDAFSLYVGGVNAREELASGLLIAAQRRAVAARNMVLVSSEADLKLEHAAVLEAHQDVKARLQDLKVAGVDDTGAAVMDISRMIAAIQQMMQQIATATEEQSAVAEEISRSITRVREVADESVASTEQTAASSVELARLGGTLQQQVGHFQV